MTGWRNGSGGVVFFLFLFLYSLRVRDGGWGGYVRLKKLSLCLWHESSDDEPAGATNLPFCRRSNLLLLLLLCLRDGREGLGYSNLIKLSKLFYEKLAPFQFRH